MVEPPGVTGRRAADPGVRAIRPEPTSPEPYQRPHDDLAVVEAVLAGDRDAFRTLVEREATAVVRACQRILGDLHEAEDASQEAFVTAYRSLSTWRGDGPFGAWLARIAVRIALRQAARRRPVAWIDPTDPDSALGADHHAAGHSRSEDPMAVALRTERAAAVRSAVAGLEEPYREVVALRFFAQRSLAEIAEITGRPLGTVKTHLHRGLLRVRLALDEEAFQ